jgi:hypothetical protein
VSAAAVLGAASDAGIDFGSLPRIIEHAPHALPEQVVNFGHSRKTLAVFFMDAPTGRLWTLMSSRQIERN